jgi:CRISPR-associated protein Cmr1
MYGADGKTPELRPASIKGVMRFWWRAINGDSDIERLKEAENRIFGSTKNRSLVTIRVNPPKIKDENIIKIGKISKMSYLWYPFYLNGAENKKSCIVNLKFKVILSSYDKNALKEASYSFILLSLFGGLGSRSRRGGGSFFIDKIDKEEYNKLLPKNSNRLQLSNHLFKTFNFIKKYFREKYTSKQLTTQYSNLSNLNFALSYNTFDSWENTLEDIEKKYKKFRDDENILDNVSFGLPLKSEHIEIFTNPKIDRRASSMIIKILQVQNNYYWFVLKLGGEFLPSDTKIGLQIDDINENFYEQIVDDFLGNLR